MATEGKGGGGEITFCQDCKHNFPSVKLFRNHVIKYHGRKPTHKKKKKDVDDQNPPSAAAGIGSGGSGSSSSVVLRRSQRLLGEGEGGGVVTKCGDCDHDFHTVNALNEHLIHCHRFKKKDVNTGTGSRKSGSSSSVVLRRRRSQRLLAQLGPRRSARLCAKSAKTKSESTSLAPRSRKPLSIPYLDLGNCPITFRSEPDMVGLRRRSRRSEARHFWYAYAHVYARVPKGSLNIKERKHILASNHKESVDKERSHGIMWVAVHGADFICAVFKNKAPDMKRILESLGREEIMPYFGKHVLWDMEELAERSDIGGKPFAVVSVTQVTHNAVDENCYKASGDEIDEEKAIEFLKCSMACESALTEVETIKTAIAGFHYLFKEKLMPEDFQVTFFHDDGNYDYFMNVDTSVIKLYLKAIEQIEEEMKCSD